MKVLEVSEECLEVTHFAANDGAVKKRGAAEPDREREEEKEKRNRQRCPGADDGERSKRGEECGGQEQNFPRLVKRQRERDFGVAAVETLEPDGTAPDAANRRDETRRFEDDPIAVPLDDSENSARRRR